jgi:hypothetical protein
MNRIAKISGIAIIAVCGMTSAWSAEKASKNLLKPKWRIYKKGIGKVIIGKDGVIACDVTGGSKKDVSGVSQTIVLNQKVAKPIFVSAECKAEKVSGKVNSNFSIYMDVRHTDGTPSYGKGLSFPVGTYDWKKFSTTYIPKKPIKSITFLLLLRRRSGKAWFKNPVCKEVAPKAKKK